MADTEAISIVEKLDKAKTDKKKIKLLLPLWQNAKGNTILSTLAILLDRSIKDRDYYYYLFSESITTAEDTGYRFKLI